VVTAIIGAIIAGLIIGALARAILPGKQNISLPITILIGIAGSVLTTLITSAVFNYDNESGGIPWIQWILSVIVAAGLIVLYGNVTARKQLN
jgi:uncharacterized membrane protein YeaQ/YmgE (transglycosylase-associated protein family)